MLQRHITLCTVAISMMLPYDNVLRCTSTYECGKITKKGVYIYEKNN